MRNVCESFFKVRSVALLALFVSSHAFALNDAAQTFTLDGKLYQAGTTNSLLDSSVKITVSIIDPSGKCMLYEEEQTVNTHSSDGYFHINVGSNTGVTKRTVNDPGRTMAQIFQNISAITANNVSGQTCPAGTFTPTAGAVRYFRIAVTPSSTGTTDVLTPDIVIDSVPQAMVAQSVQGLERANILQTNTTAPVSLSQANLEALFTTPAYTNLQAILAGNFMKSDSSGAALPIFAATPGTAAIGDIWYDSTTNQVKYKDNTGVQIVGAGGGGGGISSLTVGSSMSINGSVAGTISSGSGTIDLTNTGVAAGTYSKVTVDTKGRVTAGTVSLVEADIPNLTVAGKVSGNTITSGTISGSAGINTSGNLISTGTVSGLNVQATNLRVYNGANYAQLTAGTMSGNVNFTLPTGAGSSGQVLSTDGNGVMSWISALTNSLSSGKILVGNGSNVAAAVTMSGDGTLSNTGSLTIDTGTTANKIVRLDGAGKLPAVDGSALTNLTATNISGAVPVSKGGTNTTSFGNNHVIVSNGTGSALTDVTCSLNQVLSFDASGNVVCSNVSSLISAIVNGGNTTGADISIGTNDNKALAFKVNNATAMTISQSGNVGIGTTTPANPLELQAPLAIMLLNSSTGTNAAYSKYTNSGNSGYVGLNDSSGGWIVNPGAANALVLSSNSAPIQFGINGSAVMTLLTSGNLGIGTTSPGFKLSLSGSATSDKKIGINNTQVVYLPDQTSFTGSLFIGDGGGSLSHSSGTQGYNNTGTGIGALQSNTTGYSNAANGFRALYSNTTGIENTANGHRALQSNTTGYYNTASGSSALSSNLTGYYNTANGFRALYLSTAGHNNTANGSGALYSNQTKSESTAIGYNAMYYADDISAAPVVSYNTAIGAYSLQGSTTASNNTGTKNTALGHSSLMNMTSGSGNVGIGYNAGSSITTGSYNVVIGSNTGSTIATTSNNVLIADGQGNERMRIDNAGNVGIGTSSPSTALTVSGAFTASGMSSAPAVSAANTGRIYYDYSANKFKVSQNGAAYVDLVGGGGGGITSVGGQSGAAQSLAISVDNSVATPTITSASDTHTWKIPMASNAGTTAGLLSKTDYDTFNNKLGTTTSFAGDVSGTYNATIVQKIQGKSVTAGSVSGQVMVYDGTQWVNSVMSGAGTLDYAGKLTLNTVPVSKGGTNTTSYGNNHIIVSNGTGSALTDATCSLNQVLSFDASGYVVCSNVAALSGAIQNGGNTTGADISLGTNDNKALAFKVNNATAMTISQGGNVGIGVTNPTRALQVQHTYTGTSGAQTEGYFFQNVNPTGNSTAGNLGLYAGVYNTASNAFNQGSMTGLSAEAWYDGTGTMNVLTGASVLARNQWDGKIGVMKGMTIDTYSDGSNTGGDVTGLWVGQDLMNMKATSNVYGLYLYNYVNNGANTYGIYVDDTYQFGTNRFGIYQANVNNKNFFAGNLGIGKDISYPNTALDISGAVSLRGMASAPAVSPAGQGRFYYDTASNKFKVSQNGAAYTDLVSAGGAYVSQTGDNMTGSLMVSTGTAVGISVVSNVTSGTAGSVFATNSGGAGNAIYGRATGSATGILASSSTGTALKATTNGALVGTYLQNTNSGAALLTESNTGYSALFTRNASTTGGFATVAIVRYDAAATSNLFEVQNESSTPMAWIDSAGIYHGNGSSLTNVTASTISGTLPINKGGTNATSFAGNGVIVSNAGGTALQALNCTSGQVITFDASGYAVCGAGGGGSGFANGGNSYGADATLGTNDNKALNFEVNNTTAMTISQSGNVGIGTTTPQAKLEVAGGQAIAAFYDATTSATLDMNNGNMQTTSAAAGTITLNNLKAGGSYTLILTNATGGTYTLSAAGYSFRCQPNCTSSQVVVNAGTHTVLTIVSTNNTAYVGWMRGF